MNATSCYDKLPETLRPFGWSTPAPNLDGTIPSPWRVSHADRMKTLLGQLCPQFTDTYVEYESQIRGCEALWIGLQDNRDKDLHAARLSEISEALKKNGFKVVFSKQSTYAVLRIVDDLKRG